MKDEIIYINTDGVEAPKSSNNVMEGRKNVVDVQQKFSRALVTITITTYNRLDKTKRCVESILKYTQGIDYELIFFENGSDDGTLEYLESIPFEKKTIIKTTQNRGSGFATGYLRLMEIGRYLVGVPNDIIVTKDWLKNLIICADSDPTIGMICPSSSNVSNFQDLNLKFKNYEEMQQKAAEINRSNPAKWEERLRLITITMLIKKEVLLAVGYPAMDGGFFHDFADDDLAFRVRRMGYKAILAKDVWVHHDHPFGADSGRDPVLFQKSIEIGRQNFKDKYNGIDAWDDVLNFLDGIESLKPPKGKDSPQILGIDVRCGTPILNIKNKLKEFGCFDVFCSAFTQDSKYEVDLKTVCNAMVACDREEFMSDYFLKDYYDYIVIDKPINCYHEPQKILNDVLSMAKKGAQIFITLFNTHSFYEYLYMLGEFNIQNPTVAYSVNLDTLVEILKKDCKLISVKSQVYNLDKENKDLLQSILKGCVAANKVEECLKRLTTESYCICIEKC